MCSCAKSASVSGHVYPEATQRFARPAQQQFENDKWQNCLCELPRETTQRELHLCSWNCAIGLRLATGAQRRNDTAVAKMVTGNKHMRFRLRDFIQKRGYHSRGEDHFKGLGRERVSFKGCYVGGQHMFVLFSIHMLVCVMCSYHSNCFVVCVKLGFFCVRVSVRRGVGVVGVCVDGCTLLGLGAVLMVSVVPKYW